MPRLKPMYPVFERDAPSEFYEIEGDGLDVIRGLLPNLIAREKTALEFCVDMYSALGLDQPRDGVAAMFLWRMLQRIGERGTSDTDLLTFDVVGAGIPAEHVGKWVTFFQHEAIAPLARETGRDMARRTFRGVGAPSVNEVAIVLDLRLVDREFAWVDLREEEERISASEPLGFEPMVLVSLELNSFVRDSTEAVHFQMTKKIFKRFANEVKRVEDRLQGLDQAAAKFADNSSE